VPLRALLVDPSLFTAPYDAGLSEGLSAARVNICWATRRLRDHEEHELDPALQRQIFYPVTDRGRRLNSTIWRRFKGFEHIAGLATLLALARRFDVVHFQWAMVPYLDAVATRILQAMSIPVVLTVHDTTSFNGKVMSRWQTGGTQVMWRSADHIIVHTGASREVVVSAGADPGRVTVVPHGPIAKPSGASSRRESGRWRIILFGRLQSYKGVDLLIEALGELDPVVRDQLDVVIAGEPVIDLAPLAARAQALGVSHIVHFEPRYFSSAEMGDLLSSADCFILPYRAIDASGVLYLVSQFDRWIVASDLGAFREEIGDDMEAGELVPPGDISALAAAIRRSIGRRPRRLARSGGCTWEEIGARTRDVYERVVTSRP